MKATAIHTAQKAGAFVLRHFKRDQLLARKRATAKELTTKYDLHSDTLIIHEIEKHFPTHALLTEESGWIHQSRKYSKYNEYSEYTWIVDPLDGSTNFANGNPFFSISIALMKKDKLVLGVVFAPFLKELFVAEKGKGAFLNGKRIHVSDTKLFEKSYFLSCEGGDKTNRKVSLINSVFHSKIKDMRKLGSAALESSWVACGRADAYIVPQIAPWDVAAGVLLVQEAGGTVTDFQGKPWRVETMNLIFSNGKVHQEVLQRIP